MDQAVGAGDEGEEEVAEMDVSASDETFRGIASGADAPDGLGQVGPVKEQNGLEAPGPDDSSKVDSVIQRMMARRRGGVGR